MVAQRRPAYTHTQKVKLHNRKQLRGVMLAELSKRPKTYVDEIRRSERLAERARCKEKMAAKAPAKRKPAMLVRTDLDELAPRRKRKAAEKPAAKAKPATKKAAPKKAAPKRTVRKPQRPAAQAIPRQGKRTRRTKVQSQQVYKEAQRGLQVYKSRPKRPSTLRRPPVTTGHRIIPSAPLNAAQPSPQEVALEQWYENQLLRITEDVEARHITYEAGRRLIAHLSTQYRREKLDLQQLQRRRARVDSEMRKQRRGA